jgi:uncharacterized protein (TIGR02118 family)
MAVKITISFSDPEDPDAFVDHYVTTHVPLVEALPGLRAFEYGRALTNFDGSPATAFWVISMTFASEDAMHAAFASDAGKATIADMPNYRAGSRQSVVSEVQE